MDVLPFVNLKYNDLKRWHYESLFYNEEFNLIRTKAIESLIGRLECELRAAKRTHLECGEVLLPTGFLNTIANEVYELAECEPYGLRGCTLHLYFENDQERQKISTIKYDLDTVSTFELYLTLKQDFAVWQIILPQFLKNLTRGSGTVMISPQFTLTKKQLYRSND